VSDEPRSVVAAHMLRHAAHGEEFSRAGADHVLADDAAGDLEREALARELVDDGRSRIRCQSMSTFYCRHVAS
jgi:hypothetical protein